MKKYIDKKIFKKVIMLSAIIGIGILGINYTFCYPTKINAYVAANVYSEPANSYFDDDNFYQCVVDNYNEQNGTNISYTTSLSDDELISITNLSCSNKSIVSANGIEKLISLKKISMSYNRLTSIDVSKNLALEELWIHNNQLTELDVSNNTELKKLHSQYNKLTYLNLNSNNELVELDVTSNQLTELDVSQNLLLNEISASDNLLEYVDLSNNSQLYYIKFEYNKLRKIDIPKNVINLYIAGNDITTLDLSNNTNLYSLSIEYDLLNATVLPEELNLYMLNLGDKNYNGDILDLSNILGLNYLSTAIPFNNIILSESTKNSLYSLTFMNNNEYVDLSNFSNLKSISTTYDIDVGIYKNDKYSMSLFPFEKYLIYSDNYNIIKYGSNNSYMSKYVDDDGNVSNITEYNNIYGNPASTYTSIETDLKGTGWFEPKGKFGSGSGTSVMGKIYFNFNFNVIELISDKYEVNVEEGYINTLTDTDEDIILKNISLNYGEASIEDNKLLIKYNNELVKSFDIVGFSSDEYDLSNEYILSGGNTDLEKINVVNGEAVLEDNVIKIKHGDKVIKTFYESSFDDQNFYNCVIDSYNLSYTNKLSYKNHISEEQLQKIKKLHCSNYGKNDSEKVSSTTGLDKLTNITYLALTDNLLTEIDLSKNVELIELNLTGNQLTELDLSKNTKLDTLYLSGRSYSSPTSIIVSRNGNDLTTINLENNKLLTTLDVSNNPIKELNISNNTLLEWLSLSDTNISDLDLTNNINLKTLDISENDFTTIDLSKNTLLEGLTATNNKLTELDVSNNTNLRHLMISGNMLTELDLSKNVLLEWLYGYDNKLTNLDVSNNELLSILQVHRNELTSLDLSNNLKLNTVYISLNNFNESLYVYKGDSIIVGNNVKIPSHLNWSKQEWRISDSSVATADSDGVVSTFKSGTITAHGSSSNYFTTSTINVVEITSDKYTIDEENNIIFIKNESIDSVKDNINVSHSDVAIDIDKENNKLNVKYGKNILKEYKIVSYSSDVYDLSKNYIYIGLNSFDINNIDVTNGIGEVIDSKLQIKCGEILLEEFDVISISINTMKFISDGNLYVSNRTEEEIRDNFNVVNAEVFVYEDKIEIIRENSVLDTFKLFSINFGDLKVFEKNITVSKNISYEEFTNKITFTDGLTYKVFDGEEVFTLGIINKDLILKIYYDDKEIDYFNITNEYLIIDESINVDSDNNYFNGIDLNISVDNILNKIDTTGEVTIKNKDNKVITGTDLIGTGSIVSIKLSKETYSYTVIIHGDVDGDGVLKLSDIMKIANYTYKNKNSLTGVFELAADFDNNGSHNLQDIMKSAKALYG